MAMGIGPGAALGAIRLYLGRWTNEQDVAGAADTIARAVRNLDPRR